MALAQKYTKGIQLFTITAPPMDCLLCMHTSVQTVKTIIITSPIRYQCDLKTDQKFTFTLHLESQKQNTSICTDNDDSFLKKIIILLQPNPNLLWSRQAGGSALHSRQDRVQSGTTCDKGFPFSCVVLQQPQWSYLDLYQLNRWPKCEQPEAALGRPGMGIRFSTIARSSYCQGDGCPWSKILALQCFLGITSVSITTYKIVAWLRLSCMK